MPVSSKSLLVNSLSSSGNAPELQKPCELRLKEKEYLPAAGATNADGIGAAIPPDGEPASTTMLNFCKASEFEAD